MESVHVMARVLTIGSRGLMLEGMTWDCVRAVAGLTLTFGASIFGECVLLRMASRNLMSMPWPELYKRKDVCYVDIVVFHASATNIPAFTEHRMTQRRLHNSAVSRTTDHHDS